MRSYAPPDQVRPDVERPGNPRGGKDDERGGHHGQGAADQHPYGDAEGESEQCPAYGVDTALVEHRRSDPIRLHPVRCIQHLIQLGDNRSVLTYQPAARFWPLQWVETGSFTAVAVLLAAFCYWRVRHGKCPDSRPDGIA